MDATASEAPPATILVVEDDPVIGRMLRATLEAEGFIAVVAPTGEEGVTFALREVPEILIVDIMLPGIDGFAVVERLRNHAKTAHIPVMMLSARHDTADKVRAFDIAVDDYLTKPFHSDELIARIRTQLRHARDNLLSPLTGLPSGLRVERAIEHQMKHVETWSILYIDLDHFKAYNDIYGFVRGNDLIRLLARLAGESVRAYGNDGDFVGHIGGDDFVIVTTPQRVDAVCRDLLERWEDESKAFYSPEDLARNALVAADRQGHVQSFSLVSVSIGVVTNQRRPITSMEEVSRIAAEVKHKAKLLPGSTYYVDQRSDQRGEGGQIARG
jgi:diguanylate cyclase (GGDEF)-like protein